MSVSSSELNDMKNIMNMMNGGKPTAQSNNSYNQGNNERIELSGPGIITEAEISAMSEVMQRLDSITSDMVNDPEPARQFKQALTESKNKAGLAVGNWQISLHEDPTRLAGKQYYSIYNTATNQIIANDISLYETALHAARLLNNGEFVNSVKMRELFEQDDTYTSHRIDAHRFYIRGKKSNDQHQKQLYESRKQASLDRAVQIRHSLKKNIDL